MKKDRVSDNEYLIMVARLGFMTGLSTGVDFAMAATRRSGKFPTDQEVLDAMITLVQDYTTLLRERLEGGGGPVVEDLMEMRSKQAIERARSVWGEEDDTY